MQADYVHHRSLDMMSSPWNTFEEHKERWPNFIWLTGLVFWWAARRGISRSGELEKHFGWLLARISWKCRWSYEGSSWEGQFKNPHYMQFSCVIWVVSANHFYFLVCQFKTGVYLSGNYSENNNKIQEMLYIKIWVLCYFLWVKHAEFIVSSLSRNGLFKNGILGFFMKCEGSGDAGRGVCKAILSIIKCRNWRQSLPKVSLATNALKNIFLQTDAKGRWILIVNFIIYWKFVAQQLMEWHSWNVTAAKKEECL